MPTILPLGNSISHFLIGHLARSCHLIPPMAKSSEQPNNDIHSADDELTDQQRADLEDQALQAKYRVEYERQLRRQSCPGCAEEPFRG